MNIAEFSIRNKVTTWLLIVILVGGGFLGYEEMGKLEDPNFTIKQAKIVTLYPGASPTEVQQEVTYHVENAMQQLEQLKRLDKTISREGYSEVSVEFKDKYRAADMPNIYDEVRRKIQDMKHKLPPGAQTPVVLDDFADVYGIYLAMTGEGYTYRDMQEIAEGLQRRLVLVPGVRKVQVGGVVAEEVIVEASRAKMAELGIDMALIQKVLESQNVVADAGRIRVGDDYIRISPTGEFQSVESIGEVIITDEKNRFVRLNDIATVRRLYEEVPDSLMYQDGQKALTLAISTMPGQNVIAVGEAIEAKLDTLENLIPLGIEIHSIYNQPVEVDKSVSGFINNVVEALVIVFAVLLVFMGARVGVIIGSVLLINVAGTLWIMQMFGIELQRVSLGALIIALGMLVDNAIVIAEGMMVRIRRGENAIEAGKAVVGQNNLALFGGTVIGILAFSGIGLSQDSTGEFVGSLFYVLLISLSLSWLLAITVTPMFCAMLLRADKNFDPNANPYGGKGFLMFRGLVARAIQFRWVTIPLVLAIFVSSVFGFGYVKQAFFPSANTPMFFVDVWEVEGTDIRTTRDDALKVDAFIRELEGVEQTTLTVGQGAARFSLVYSPESQTSAYAQIIVRVQERSQIPGAVNQIRDFLADELPHTEPKIKTLRIGPGKDAKIEARFMGPNPAVLKRLADEAKTIMYADPLAIEVRDDWRQPVRLIRPIFNENVARQLGISRDDVAAALEMATQGSQFGVYRDGNHLLPIKVRSADDERGDVANLQDIQVWSQVLKNFIPIGQVVQGFETVYEDAIIMSRNRSLAVTANANPAIELAAPVFNELRPKIEAIDLPVGYRLEWGGEYQDSNEAQESLFSALPAGFLMMVIVTILLFGKLRQPLIIWLTVPLSIIGITYGLLIARGAFDFMALLGALALIGLMIKNSIVLVEEIDHEIAGGKQPLTAILDSAVSRMRPVMMAASTTILGLIPLLQDVFFQNMSITMMAGLGVATVLTLVVAPTFYAVLFKVKFDKSA
ncbi:Cobalt-zinc-cadmium resistance protein CzcA [BD1-7 clade bacterium]|uniref:Cobalt-zinc-cadmium resistance protein CzcA n=1 Tax=BD1-7 clade bacterium TaxID=2029982 RepID=A0A5S9NXB3_9GAMM|nr:Cobalt-zinc-cadmium resistance protein CzcA [BD1-7 clade bacterium]CAA0110449.1 Cobalt-zinc-cadmium resistance protein CzcA [BD1-7 clade bacterium]